MNNIHLNLHTMSSKELVQAVDEKNTQISDSKLSDISLFVHQIDVLGEKLLERDALILDLKISHELLQDEKEVLSQELEELKRQQQNSLLESEKEGVTACQLLEATHELARLEREVLDLRHFEAEAQQLRVCDCPLAPMYIIDIVYRIL